MAACRGKEACCPRWGQSRCSLALSKEKLGSGPSRFTYCNRFFYLLTITPILVQGGMWCFVFGLFLLLNTMMRSSPAYSEKKFLTDKKKTILYILNSWDPQAFEDHDMYSLTYCIDRQRHFINKWKDLSLETQCRITRHIHEISTYTHPQGRTQHRILFLFLQTKSKLVGSSILTLVGRSGAREEIRREFLFERMEVLFFLKKY